MGALGEEKAAEIVIDSRVDPAGVAFLTLSGELDSSNVEALEETVAAVIAAHAQRLIFDLGGLRFMDSAGIAVLMGSAGQVESVHLRNPSPIVRRIIEVTGLGDFLLLES